VFNEKRIVMTKALLVCGAMAGPLFVVVFLFEGATRANYDPLRHPVSSLALGDYGWVQSANFVVTGLLTLGAAVFVTDPVSGYPPGAPDRLSGNSWHGALHDLFSLLGFVALAAACFVFGRRFAGRGKRGWALYSAVSGGVFAVLFVLSSAGFAQVEGLVDLAGLLQRVAVAVGFGWLTLLAVHLLRGLSSER
jgi:hypothetical membrane protein